MAAGVSNLSSSQHHREATSKRGVYHLMAYGMTAIVCFMQMFLMEEPRFTNEHGAQSMLSSPLTSDSHLPRKEPIRNLEDGTRLVIDGDRTLWMAGWHARFARYYAHPPPIITWTREAEEYIEQEYRRLHFPLSCSNVKGYMITNTYSWGVMSALRDYQSDVFRAMAQNYTLVHQGLYGLCPDNPERFLNCFWEDMNGCQSQWAKHPDLPRVELSQGTTTAVLNPDEFPHWLWEALYRQRMVCLQDSETGKEVTESDIHDADQYFQLKQSVLRAIFTKQIFKPRSNIRSTADALLEQWQRNLTDDAERPLAADKAQGLIVHMRRTDKKIDLGPHWHHIDFQSTAHLGLMVQAMEATLNSTFHHVFAMSDDPEIEQRALDELRPFFASSPANLVSHQLCDLVGASHAEYNGHETLNATQRHELYTVVISQMYAASQVADYLIGSGSCGVSQFIAQLLGGKHMIEPSFLAMWEEDIVVKKCRWILRQQEALSDRCSPSAGRSVSDHISRPYQQAVLAREWEAHECSMFSYALPACLSSSG